MKCAKTERELTAHRRLISGFWFPGNQATPLLANYFTLVSHVLNAYWSRLARKIHNCSADGNGKLRAYIQEVLIEWTIRDFWRCFIQMNR